MRTGEKAGRTAAKRRTEVRRLCVRTILQGDEAQRNNPVIRPSVQHWGDIIILYNIRINGLGTGCVRRPKIRVCSAWHR